MLKGETCVLKHYETIITKKKQQLLIRFIFDFEPLEILFRIFDNKKMIL